MKTLVELTLYALVSGVMGLIDSKSDRSQIPSQGVSENDSDLIFVFASEDLAPVGGAAYQRVGWGFSYQAGRATSTTTISWLAVPDKGVL